MDKELSSRTIDLIPDELNIFVGGFMAPSYSVELEGSGIRYRRFDDGYSELEQVVMDVPEQRWRKFRACLDRCRVWDWRKEYLPQVMPMDGTHWHLTVRYQDREIESAGDNHYPGYDNPNPEGIDNKTFDRVMKGVSRLLGNRPFE